MGFESINFHFVPQAACSEQLDAALLKYGAEAIKTDSRFAAFRLSGPDYHLDIQIGCYADIKHQSVSVRMALCNPPEAERRLHDLLFHLLETCGGYLIAPRSRRRIAELDEEEWQKLTASIAEARDRFQQCFGEWQAALPAEDVMSHYRKMTGKPVLNQ
jgi:hypothetical protein